MKSAAQITFAERLGRTLGRMWRGCVRLDRKANGWLVAQGLPVGPAKTILWVVKLAVLVVLFYAVSWLAVLVGLVVVVAWIARGFEQSESTEWAIGEQAEHKKSVF